MLARGPLVRPYRASMLRVYGVPVTEEDGRYLVAKLLAAGSLDAVSAAERIADGVKRGLFYTVALTAPQREVVFSILEDPPAGLIELHRKLGRDQAGRERTEKIRDDVLVIVHRDACRRREPA